MIVRMYRAKFYTNMIAALFVGVLIGGLVMMALCSRTMDSVLEAVLCGLT